MDKYSIFGLIKQYNENIEHYKDSDDTDNYKGLGKEIMIIVIIGIIIQLILWISALVLLIKNKTKLQDKTYNLCIALLVLGLIFLPIILPITVIVVVLTERE